MEEKRSKVLEKYRTTHQTSKELWKRAKSLFPGGVSHNIRTWDLPKLNAYPFFLKDANGCKIWDEDENEYIDFWIGHLELLFGHTPKHVIKAVREQALHGLHWGVLNKKAVQLATLIREFVPSIEKLRFTNTGTEATMYAVRLARAYTGNKKILKIRSGWHGANSDLLFSIHYPFSQPESQGLLPSYEQYCESLPFNNQEETKKTIRKHKDDIAGIIIEPVLGAGGGIPAKKEYLKLLRDEANEYGFCLIFDEVITGFRLGKGGAQAYYGVIPDLTVLGKTTGGGLPIGVVGGQEEIMDIASPRKKASERALIGGGTFSVNPMTMTAGLATLRRIKQDEERIYQHLNKLGDYTREQLKQLIRNYEEPAKVVGTHSIVMLHFLSQKIEEITPKQLQKFKAKEKSIEFRMRLLNKGIFQFHGMGALCTAHKKKHLDTYLTAVDTALKNMK